MTLVSPSRFDSIFPDVEEETHNYPTIACIKNMELWLGPPPGGAYVIEMEYLRSGDDSASGDPTDYTWIPEPDRWLIVDFAVSEAFEMLQDYDRADRARAKYNGGVSSARRADSRRKWSTSEKRARNIFQAR